MLRFRLDCAIAATAASLAVGCAGAIDGDRSAGASPEIYGGTRAKTSDPIARSTVALFSGADHDTGFALVDGSATLVAPNVAVGAAHTCLKFAPRYVSFGVTLPEKGAFDSYDNGRLFPNVRHVVKCVAHPNYDDQAASNDDQASHPVHDIAVFFFDGTPSGFGPAPVLAKGAALPHDVTIAGFGSYEDQLDNVYTTGMKPYELRRVDSFISQDFPKSLQFKDGPNPGRGSCQGDSGGSVYRRVTTQVTAPVLVGIPVSGPACDEGIGFDTDVRPHIEWIEGTARVRLTAVP